MSALLSVTALQKSFGAVIVADATSFDVAQGEAVGILGPNGAGKTSLFNLITGSLRPDGGMIQFDGRDITKAPPAARCKMGVARSFQIPQPFVGMTVFETRSLVPAKVQVCARARPRRMPWTFCMKLGWRKKRTCGLAHCHCWNASVWSSRVHWPPNPSCCCLMNHTKVWHR